MIATRKFEYVTLFLNLINSVQWCSWSVCRNRMNIKEVGGGTTLGSFDDGCSKYNNVSQETPTQHQYYKHKHRKSIILPMKLLFELDSL